MLDGIRTLIEKLAASLPGDYPPSALSALLMVMFVGIACGSVGSLVVGNRMAFFSDALAHCAFAGVTLGMLLSLSGGKSEFERVFVPLFMIGFGVVVGVSIAFVREHSPLASDTIIGVFFAFAVGLGGMLLAALRRSRFLNPEAFLFGSLIAVDELDLLIVSVLLIVTALVLFPAYNAIVLASFNASLARSRGIRVRLWNYVFVVLLALIVNVCIRAVGALLINALLVVPAATAANLGRSVRSVFWWSIGVSVVAGVIGLWASSRYQLNIGRGQPIDLAASGTIVVLSVLAFFASLAFRIVRDRRRPSPALSS